MNTNVKTTARELLATNSGYTAREAIAEAREYWENIDAGIKLGLLETEDRERAENHCYLTDKFNYI